MARQLQANSLRMYYRKFLTGQVVHHAHLGQQLMQA